MTRGQHVFITMVVSDATLKIGASSGTIPTSAVFPLAGLLGPDGGDDTQYTTWFYNVASFTCPTTVSQASVTTTTFAGIFLGGVA